MIVNQSKMSALRVKRTRGVAVHMSAFGPKRSFHSYRPKFRPPFNPIICWKVVFIQIFKLGVVLIVGNLTKILSKNCSLTAG